MQVLGIVKNMETERLTANRKALHINLDPRIFGTFAEIGAGQEVARHFFRVGGASGTIAKTMSAYDMTFSDEIYGKGNRYVSRERLLAMLNHEYELLIQRLNEKRGDRTLFFAFANTVAARGYAAQAECHGWMGIRFQHEPLAPPSDILMHVRMLDQSGVMQQQALGTIGVNLIYSAYFCKDVARSFVPSLLDDLSNERIEVDMLAFSGPAFPDIDNRKISLQLVQLGLTDAILFDPAGKVLQPSELLYKKPVLVERGSFRPVTNVNIDMLLSAREAFVKEPEVQGKEIITLAELTLHNLMVSGTLDESDFLARVDVLSALGFHSLISDYAEFYRLMSYFRRYTRDPIGFVLGVNTLIEVFNEKYYENVEGGICEGLGRFLRPDVKVYTYPMAQEAFKTYLQLKNIEVEGIDETAQFITAENMPVPHNVRLLYKYFRENDSIVPITAKDHRHADILSRAILERIVRGTSDWEDSVPPVAAEIIKRKRLFGWRG